MVEYKAIVHLTDKVYVELTLKQPLPFERTNKFRVDYSGLTFNYSRTEEKENEVLYHFIREVTE